MQEKSGGRWILEIDASFAFFYKKKGNNVQINGNEVNGVCLKFDYDKSTK